MGSLEARALPKAAACGVVTASLVGADDMLGTEVVDCDGTHIGELQDMICALPALPTAWSHWIARPNGANASWRSRGMSCRSMAMATLG